jgi:NAD-dependent dihydropyrimidine dehydrogenase PreA subunit
MRIREKKCIGCGQCVIVCPVGAIEVKNEKAVIDDNLCVECSVCYRDADCPTSAIRPSRLKWPRVVRNPFSDVISTHKLTGVPGRGTEEMKTNDVSQRFKSGEVGVSIEIGRPGVSTILKNVNLFTEKLTPLGVKYEEASPVTALLNDEKTTIKKEIEDERVLSAIIEFKVTKEKLKNVLDIIKEVDRKITTVFTAGIISTFEENKNIPVIEKIQDLGFSVRPNAKINIGLGRKLMEEET